jgi:hypothetical protein
MLPDSILVAFGMNNVSEKSLPVRIFATIVRTTAVGTGKYLGKQFSDKSSPYPSAKHLDTHGVQVVPRFVRSINLLSGSQSSVGDSELTFTVFQMNEIAAPADNLGFHWILLFCAAR